MTTCIAGKTVSRPHFLRGPVVAAKRSSGASVRSTKWGRRWGGAMAAVVELHGCDGIGPHYRQWVQHFADWGCAAVLTDSFGPRGIQEVCNRRLLVPRRHTRAAPSMVLPICMPLFGCLSTNRGDRFLAWWVGAENSVLDGLVRRANEPAVRPTELRTYSPVETAISIALSNSCRPFDTSLAADSGGAERAVLQLSISRIAH